MTNCWLPYYHAELLTDGTVRPCCKYEGEWITSIDQYADKDRQEFTQSELSTSCSACNVAPNQFSYKKAKTFYFRQHGWTEPTVPSLRNLNISIDNVCASSCVQCSPKQSTTIAQLLGQPLKLNWNLNLLDPYLNSLEHVTISGGEPLQSPRLVDLCDKLKQSNIKTISIATGLSRIKQQNLTALEALGVPLFFRVSIDAPWHLNEWIRGCTKRDWLYGFDQISKHPLGWQITLGAYNVFALPELLDYIETLKPNGHIQPSPILDPESHSVRQLPVEIKEQVIKKLEAYNPQPNNREIVATALGLLKETNTLDWNECVDKIEQLPRLRGVAQDLNYFFECYL